MHSGWKPATQGRRVSTSRHAGSRTPSLADGTLVPPEAPQPPTAIPGVPYTGIHTAAFAENAVQYQSTLAFLNGRIGQITRALKGE